MLGDLNVVSTALEILEPWIPLRGASAESWEDSFAREVTKEHPLYGVPVKALACERVWGIYRLLRHDSQYAIVERTWSARPEFELYRDAHDLMKDVIYPHHSEWLNETLMFIRDRGHFSVQLAPSNYDVHASLEAHETVLRPLLHVAEECWVYGLSSESSLCPGSSAILEARRGKHRIRSNVEAILGHELLWNARGGQRGTIVIVVSSQSLLTAEVFRHCSRPYVVGNVGAGHTPSALRFAKQVLQVPDRVSLLFSRTNGLDSIDIFAEPDLASSLFKLAYRQNDGRPCLEYT